MALLIKNVTVGLSDPSMEIKILCHSIIQKIVKLPIHISLDLESLIEPLKSCVFLKTKETAVKQDVENNRNFVLSGLKTVQILDEISSPDPKLKWPGFINEIKAADLFDQLTL